MSDKFVAAQMVSARRRDPNDRERLAAAALAAKRAKHKGRNHWRNWERRQMAAEKRWASLAKVEKRKAAFGRYVEEVRAYWRGDRPDLPAKPTT
jgi:hypothetical protein